MAIFCGQGKMRQKAYIFSAGAKGQFLPYSSLKFAFTG